MRVWWELVPNYTVRMCLRHEEVRMKRRTHYQSGAATESLWVMLRDIQLPRIRWVWKHCSRNRKTIAWGLIPNP